MRLYNSLTLAKEDFAPADPHRVTMYVCGPTVYNFAHIGNARPAVVFDVLFRVLRRRWGEVAYVRNLTDVDDKIIRAALDAGEPIGAVTERFTRAYHEDMAALGVLPPTQETKATEHVPHMLHMIERLIAGGHAYAADGHVLFHVPSFPEYGRLSRRDRDDMIAGARVEVAPYKRDPADFVLWKPSSPDQPGWESPYGRGRPGWHIECSAMIEATLGRTVDIHGGGQDLKFPHHENEIAQSCCANHAPLARYWVHNGFVNVDHEKMSKSLGNVLLVRDLLADAPGEAIRCALLGAHYRAPLDWTDEGLGQARRGLDRLYRTLRDLPEPADAGEPPAGLVEALEDDLNTPMAFAELFGLAREANASSDEGFRRAAAGSLRAGGALLGVLQTDPAAWLAGGTAGDDPEVAEIERLVAARTAARKARDFAEADRLRDALVAMNVMIEDRPDGTRWSRSG